MPRSNLFNEPIDEPLIDASILGADFATMGADCQAAIDAGADALHLDVMDGHFVPNLTMGPDLCRSLRAALPDAFLDVHLMVADPAAFVVPFAEAGADHFTFHIEVAPDPGPLIDAVRDAGMSAGLAMNPPTPIDLVLPHVEGPDLLLVMSVNPGFAGQAFIGEVLKKAAAIHPLLRPEQRLQIDGGVTPDNAAVCLEAGCDVLVAASAIFRAVDYRQAIAGLRHPEAAAIDGP